MFQLQRSPGSTEGLPSLVLQLASFPLSSLFLFFPGVRSKQLFPLHVLFCALLADHTPTSGSLLRSRLAGAEARCLLPSPFVAAEEAQEPGTAALLF